MAAPAIQGLPLAARRPAAAIGSRPAASSSAPLARRLPHRRLCTRQQSLITYAKQTTQPSEQASRNSKAGSSNGATNGRSPMLESTDLHADSDDEGCDVFLDSTGQVMEVMCCDYGFRSGFGRLYQGQVGEIPKSFFALGMANFAKEFKQLRRSVRFDEYNQISKKNPATNPISKATGAVAKKVVQGLAFADRRLEAVGVLSEIKDKQQYPDEAYKGQGKGDGELTDDCSDVRSQLAKLHLNDAAVWRKEKARPHVASPWYIRGAYLALCIGLDLIYANRPIQRFWFLETVARMPYFSYISMLHLYESLGWWRAGAELRKVHFAEEWNELHHLQIMESLGGDQLWIDRFLAQHAAVFYFWVIIVFFIFSPKLAYNFSELVEGHATDTYEQFAEENKELLTSLPPPLVALEYYKAGDLYMFDMFQTSKESRAEPRRPACNNLYDVFCNIRDDESEHVKTMKSCQDYSIVAELAGRKDAVTMKDPERQGIKDMDETKLD
ncbi:hypothetical protein WJX72_009421 [[Myrmecia] bisecta]|uniref:Ubiquinol oxidase n=1 Tax=[Myrmecia] bisecta TaxID=41462 RepID=A0AAW1QG34_9CHLO